MEFRIELPGAEGCLSGTIVQQTPGDLSATSTVEAYIDTEKIALPLQVRHWQAGDSFQPLGMNGQTQKLQDFFTNQKVDRFTREKIWLLLNGDGEMIWVIGHRLDDRFKVRKSTKQILYCRFEWA